MPSSDEVSKPDNLVSDKAAMTSPKTAAAAAATPPSRPNNAELKAQKKAEKAARRQQETERKQVGSVASAPVTAGKPETAQGSQRAKVQTYHKRTGSTTTDAKSIAIRGAQQHTPVVPETPQREDKTIELFRDLYKTRNTTPGGITIAGVNKDVHPAVLALGQQMSSYTVCGSNARLVATLLAFKRVLESYTTPPGHSLGRHFTSHVLSPQIDYLTSCRPLSVSMGTAIRWLKLEISKVDPNEPDDQATASLCEAIDTFIRERVTLADKVIAETASEHLIKDGDVILTYAKSSVVLKAILRAHDIGRTFRVIVVDSRPLFEGKALARDLVGVGISVKYCLMNGLSHCVQDATKVLLGAHAMMSNGRLFSRIGTAQVAMEAKDLDVPVIVLCETIKCTEKVALDSIVRNEVAPESELILPSTIPGKSGTLAGWRDMKNLQILNLMYDVTPADYLAMIVTESGIVPPSSVPVLQRLANEAQ
jgi:translation initiation factor eIF-2B subunit delta